MRTSPDGELESRLSSAQYAAIAAIRYELRRFLAFSEAAAANAGIPPQQHQALLVIAGHTGAEPPTVGVLADQLLIAPHTAAELASRMVDAALLTKTASTIDRRRVELALTRKAEELLRALTTTHLTELESLGPSLTRALARLKRTRP